MGKFDFNDMDSHKMINVMVIILVIGIFVPLLFAMTDRMNGIVTTVYENVYIDREVNNSNVTMNANFSNIDVKEPQRFVSNINESQIDTNDSIFVYETYQNITANISISIMDFNLTNTEYNKSYDVNYDTFSTNIDGTIACNTATRLFSSFRAITTNISKIEINGTTSANTNINLSICSAYANNEPNEDNILYTIASGNTGLAGVKNVTFNTDFRLYNNMTNNSLFYIKLKTVAGTFYWENIKTIDNTTSYKYATSLELLSCDFAVNYTFIAPQFLNNISINDIVFNESVIQFYKIDNVTILDNITIIFDRFNQLNYAFNITIDLITDYINITIDTIQITDILIYSNQTIDNASRFIQFYQNSESITIFSIYNQNTTQILLHSESNNLFMLIPFDLIEFTLNKSYVIEINSLLLMESWFEANLTIYEDNISIDSFSVNTYQMSEEYIFV